MAKTILNVKTDKEVKEKAQLIAKELGLPLSTVVNAFLKQFIREQKVSFSTMPQMTPYLERLIGKVHADAKKGINMAGPFENQKELKRHLDSLKRKA